MELAIQCTEMCTRTRGIISMKIRINLRMVLAAGRAFFRVTHALSLAARAARSPATAYSTAHRRSHKTHTNSLYPMLYKQSPPSLSRAPWRPCTGGSKPDKSETIRARPAARQWAARATLGRRCLCVPAQDLMEANVSGSAPACVAPGRARGRGAGRGSCAATAQEAAASKTRLPRPLLRSDRGGGRDSACSSASPACSPLASCPRGARPRSS